VPRRLGVASLLVAGIVAGLFGAGAAESAKPTVTISGRAYAFNHMDTFLSGATIRVRELPGVSTTTDANGDYILKVPDNANVTPYIDPPAGYHQIDLQTFHTRGEPIENANFQTPADAEYNGLAALLSVQLGPDGRPTQCAIVTTASARNVRGVDYATFEERTPHGVAGANAHAVPSLPPPTYFNESVIPDRTQPSTSGDGGIIWTEVPAGTYRVITESPSTKFASFLATCKPGRIVNANPPWGAYELATGEQPLAAGQSVATIKSAKVITHGNRRLVKVKVDAAEAIKLRMTIREHGERVGPAQSTRVDPEDSKAQLDVARYIPTGRAKVRIELIDAAGDAPFEQFALRMPSPPSR
jgi:hypothetical protein